MLRLCTAYGSRLLLRFAATVCIVAACDSPTGPADLDRRLIVYFVLDSDWDLYRVSPNGGTPTRLNLPMLQTLFPSLSPDGSRLAFVVESDPEGVYVGGADGSGARLVWPYRTDRITWSPDGTRLAVGFDGEIVVVPLNGGSPQTITGAVDVFAAYPSWSSTGRIAFHTMGLALGSDIYTMAADGSDLRPLVSGDGDEARDPAWSPDGSSLAFALGRFGASFIYTVSANGSDRQRVSAEPPSGASWTDLGPTWSPSGQRIAHQREHDAACPGAPCGRRWDVLVVGRDGQDERNLTAGTPWGGVRPSW
jgi:Tol biopolymer transport system component